VTHSCQRSLCDTPHDAEPINTHFAMKEYLSDREAFDKALCPHGFRRLVGTPLDCHFCSELEKGAVQ